MSVKVIDGVEYPLWIDDSYAIGPNMDKMNIETTEEDLRIREELRRLLKEGYFNKE